MPLVTEAEVKTVTGQTVDADDLAMAHAVVDILGDVDLDSPQAVDKLGTRDLSLLRKAIAFQAAWLSEQIDYTARTDVAAIAGATSTGGVELRDDLSLVLAPLAKQALSRVTWKTRKTMNDPTRAARRWQHYVPPPGVVVSYDPADCPQQADAFLRDAGPYWGELDAG